MDIFQKVKYFHKKYNLEQNPNNYELQRARCRHMIEELMEYVKAHREGNREQQLDALVDLVYVALGTAYYEGFDFNGAFDEVHQCNMKKIQRPTDRSKWDVVKPEGWVGPQLKEYT